MWCLLCCVIHDDGFQILIDYLSLFSLVGCCMSLFLCVFGRCLCRIAIDRLIAEPHDTSVLLSSACLPLSIVHGINWLVALPVWLRHYSLFGIIVPIRPIDRSEHYVLLCTWYLGWCCISSTAEDLITLPVHWIGWCNCYYCLPTYQSMGLDSDSV